MKKEKIEIQ